MRTVTKIVTAWAAAYYLFFGVWAFVAPGSFAESIANYPPYNEHLTHDSGAFSIGLGVAALAGLLLYDALAVVLAGLATALLLHGVSHLLDQGLGGRSSDPWTVSVIGLVIVCAFVVALDPPVADLAQLHYHRWSWPLCRSHSSLWVAELMK
jgi:hypothetical protein